MIISGATNNTIGGTDAGARNVISGNTGGGVVISGGSNNQVQGNLIGTAADGTTALGNSNDGVIVANGALNNLIGGTIDGAGNVIWFNGGNGVTVGSSSTDASTGNSILRNSIYANTKLGIDLGNDGPTPNNTLGPGPNNFQNYPVLASASSSATGTTVTGSLNSTPSTTFRIEFFSNPAPASGQQAQGQTYLGYLEVTTDPSGNASFSFHTTAQVVPGQVITATATNLTTGDTSEFCPPVSTVGVIVATTGLAVAGASGTYGGTTTLTATLTAGGVGVPGQTVTFTLNGQPFSGNTATTDGSGVATLSNVSLAGINASTYPNGIGASFAGDTNYAASSGTGALTVNQAATGLTVAGVSGTYGGATTLTATLKRGRRPLSGQTVTFTLNGQPFSGNTATTDGSGVATLSNVSLAGINASTYPNGIGASFAGDTNYSGSNSTGALTVNKANQSIQWSNPADIGYGTALSTTQLNATVTGVPGGSAPAR